ncbi:MAG TPA: patatin-like phospholipase family protein [Gemmatimonadaceae bacterium]|nr:patatin-like phospholipase family protein [Gemmatimonadaceae bacterium]
MSSSLVAEPGPSEATSIGGPNDSLALMLGGGGARGAYQAGVLHGIARRFPNLRFPIMTGISAGAVNTLHLASQETPPGHATQDLIDLWLKLSSEQVYEAHTLPLLRNVVRWGNRLLSGGSEIGPEPMRGMIDTAPLRKFLNRNLISAEDGTLPGIGRNIASGSLRAVALSATSYATGHSVTWIEGQNVELWQRPQRRSEATHLTVEHVMASSALPMLFPAVRVGDQWFGDGGIRLTSPLSPPLHLGASRIITISTRHRPSWAQLSSAASRRYPPPAQVLGVLYNSVFLDLIDEDILRLEKVNQLLADLPADKRESMRIVDILVIRPSQDLHTLARELEPRLPSFLRYLTRGLGTRQASNTEIVSLIMFQSDYLRRLVELGEADADAQAERIDEFLARPALINTKAAASQ